ncbi:MAG: hypothetical protein IJS53_03550 [Clostridia bacterium]|nr:hypothetical protein [Clostridia bacterium]
MQLLCLFLSVLLALPAPALRLTAAATGSDTLPAGALSALEAVLDQTALTLTADAFRLDHAGEALLSARLGEALCCNDAACALDGVSIGSADLAQTAQALGELLAPWEAQSEQAVDLQEAGSARTVFTYALTGEEWAELLPQAAALLGECLPGAEAIAGAEIVGKGTFKRYFDKDGREIGAYFYAAEVHLNGEAREVRLEYAMAPGKGFFVAFRCPNAKGTSDFRVSLHGKDRGGAYTLSGEIRRAAGADSDVVTLDGKTDGKLTINYSRKRGGATAAYALTLTLREGGADFTYALNRRAVLRGTLAWEAAEAPDLSLPAPNADLEGVASALALRLYACMRAASPGHWQELAHALAAQTLIDAQAEE